MLHISTPVHKIWPLLDLRYLVTRRIGLNQSNFADCSSEDDFDGRSRNSSILQDQDADARTGDNSPVGLRASAYAQLRAHPSGHQAVQGGDRRHWRDGCSEAGRPRSRGRGYQVQKVLFIRSDEGGGRRESSPGINGWPGIGKTQLSSVSDNPSFNRWKFQSPYSVHGEGAAGDPPGSLDLDVLTIRQSLENSSRRRSLENSSRRWHPSSFLETTRASSSSSFSGSAMEG
jgi:hypothetical protein